MTKDMFMPTDDPKRTMLRVLAIGALLLICTSLALAVPGQAQAHILVTHHHAFYFSGTTYTQHSDNSYSIEDPVNLMVFEDSANRMFADDTSVATGLQDHWQGPRSLVNDQSSGYNCIHAPGGYGPSESWLKELSYASANGKSQAIYDTHTNEVLNGSLGSFTQPPIFNSCVKEYHYRWWNDRDHAYLTNMPGTKDGHGIEGQFVFGAVHYENRASRGAHYIDRDWFLARNQFIHNERGLCSRPRFLYDPASDSAAGYRHRHSHYHSDGWIGYISLHPTPGCP